MRISEKFISNLKKEMDFNVVEPDEFMEIMHSYHPDRLKLVRISCDELPGELTYGIEDEDGVITIADDTTLDDQAFVDFCYAKRDLLLKCSENSVSSEEATGNK